MATLLAIPPVEREVFPSPPLKAMLGQIRFPSLLRLADASGVAPLQDLLRRDYPTVNAEQIVGIVIDPGGVRSQGEPRQWRLASADGSWSVVVTPDFVNLEAAAPEYTDYNEFRDRFATVWEAVLQAVEPAERLQQGLRYINHLERESPSFDWSEIINEQLLGFLMAAERREQLEHSLTDARFRIEHGVLSMKYGVVRAGEHNRPGFLLDFDCFTQEHADHLGVDEVLATFDSFHDTIYSLFRWCTTDRALEDFRRANSQ